jgi:hypothetical protein
LTEWAQREKLKESSGKELAWETMESGGGKPKLGGGGVDSYSYFLNRL